MFYWVKQERRGGWYLFNEHGETVPPTKHQTAEARGLVWEHAKQLVEEAAAGGAGQG